MSRQVAYFSSGERDSCVEHLVHLARLENVESVQFSTRNKQFEAPPPSSAMLNKHTRRALEEEARIRHENQILWDKIESQARYGEKLRRDALEKLKHQKESYAGSNIHRRTLEARRIDRDNRTLCDRIMAASPRVETRQQLAQSARYQSEQARLHSRFKSPLEMPKPPRRPHPDDEADAAEAARETSRTPRLPRVGSARGLSTERTAERDIGPGWNHVTRDDVKRRERDRDRRLKGHPPLGDSTIGARQRTHNPTGWCDRDEQHRRHVEHVKRLQQEEPDEDAHAGTASGGAVLMYYGDGTTA